MDIFDTFATDEALEIEGRWVPFNDKTSFKIARAGNKHFGRIFSRLYTKNKATLDSKGEAAEQRAEEILIEASAKTILLDWKGPVMLKGVDMPYSEDNAKKLLAVKDFRRWVDAQAADVEGFKVVQEAEDVKN